MIGRNFIVKNMKKNISEHNANDSSGEILKKRNDITQYDVNDHVYSKFQIIICLTLQLVKNSSNYPYESV